MRESLESASLRWKQLEMIQGAYPDFIDFLHDGMELLGFVASDIQEDIADFVAYGPHYLMVQAQRGQAKTTIVALFVVWCLIHKPDERALIVSAGGPMATEISTLIVRIIMTLDILECMRPDPSNGDRTSVEAFDLHYTLKGVDKSPSVACVGITGTLQGKRAGLLIADDVESKKNSATALMRAQLLELTRDFSSICEKGRIIYLGTPQSQDSIYNTLPSRGFTVRIWPGRYPTQQQLAHYGEHLAPLIRKRLEADPSLGTGGGALGDQGKPIDPRLNEELLQKKELDQGTPYFQLQHMLNTALADALRYPLKSHLLVMMEIDPTSVPLTVTRNPLAHTFVDCSVHGHSFKLSVPQTISEERAPLQAIVMYVDPAGGGANADETAYSVIGFLNGNMYLLDVGGVPGGYEPHHLQPLTDVAIRWNVHEVCVEKNLGHGAFAAAWTPLLKRQHPHVGITEDYATGKKEIRIADTLGPVMGRGSLIVNASLVERDIETTQRYEPAKRMLYSFFFQLCKLTLDTKSLVHDDRLDAVAGGVKKWVAHLAQDQEKAIARQRSRELAAWVKDPMQKDRYAHPKVRRGRPSMLNKYTR